MEMMLDRIVKVKQISRTEVGVFDERETYKQSSREVWSVMGVLVS